MIVDTATDLDELTEMKIRLPIKHHIRLHAAKYVTGKPIGEMVAEALEAYLPARLEAQGPRLED